MTGSISIIPLFWLRPRLLVLATFLAFSGLAAGFSEGDTVAAVDGVSDIGELENECWIEQNESTQTTKSEVHQAFAEIPQNFFGPTNST